VKPKLMTGQDVQTQVVSSLGRSGKTMAAVAYVTKDHLDLRAGDALVVNASTEAIEAGATDPRLLIALAHRGVEIGICPDLHAKLIVRGDHVAVGSANLSGRTTMLNEATVVHRDPTLAGLARRYITDLLNSGRTTQPKLEALVALLPNRRGRRLGHEPAGGPRRGRLFDARSVGTVWLYEWSPYQFRPGVSAATAPADTDATGLDGRDWVLIENDTRARFGDVFVSFAHGWIDRPQRYLASGPIERREPGSRWALVGYSRRHRSVRKARAPQDLLEKASANPLGIAVPRSRVRELLDLWPN
jgi:hypothetical protein